MTETLVVSLPTITVPRPSQKINLDASFLPMKPALLQIVQPMSDIATKGAKVGELYLDNGDRFNELTVVFLQEPSLGRKYYEGPGEFNRIPENLKCFSYDMIAPNPEAPEPQSITCATCPQSDWGPWREYKEKTKMSNKDLIPKCDPQFFILLLDTKNQLPLRMYVRGKSKQTFEDALGEFARVVVKLRSNGLDPNYPDISFRLTTEAQGKNYVLKVDKQSFRYIDNEEDRNKFGEIYKKLTNYRDDAALEKEKDTLVQVQAAKSIEAELVQPGHETNVLDGDEIPF